ncbi:EscU/YscU/HrcU family type III secretion system export apparatus switch protein [Sphingomonas jatrophae]|uniref:Flagellar biosynthetic protein FlhB n=1 Tax=Sphingomonas jatrophae TaxID=1166337 RepID=A0A1I6MBA2_9SPHN|nr:flagellar type III secretion system protein FlhB [Sphingomonas jatrophae]SFS12984.1 flagellar biosynthetic protein FlhB [Sphingomonas jatrophae]
MAESEQDKTEAPTPKKRADAAKQGDVLQSRDLATALVIVGGAAWLALAGPWMLGALKDMLASALSFDAGAVEGFDPGRAVVRLLLVVALPLAALLGITLIAAVAAPALLGSLGFRTDALGFKPNKMNPMAGLSRMFGKQGLAELVKSLAKVGVLGAVGVWLLMGRAREIVHMGTRDAAGALAEVGSVFVLAILVMAVALAAIAMIDVPTQIFQRMSRLRMTKEEVKEEHKQSEGSPELKAQIRRRQHETLRASARGAIAEATVVLANPTHFAVALRYRPGQDAAPMVVARGRGDTALAIRALADEHAVPVLRYPQLARALYFTARTGQTVREDLYLAVATVLAFVFNLDRSLDAESRQPDVTVPPDARFDEDGRRE